MKFYNGQEEINGLLFIKSMRNINNVKKQAMMDAEYAMKACITCKDIALDDGASTSVDRSQMRELMERLDTGKYQVLVVEDVYDITRESEDLRTMIDRINDMGVLIFDLGIMGLRFNNYDIEC